jgi:hypothetical protein
MKIGGESEMASASASWRRRNNNESVSGEESGGVKMAMKRRKLALIEESAQLSGEMKGGIGGGMAAWRRKTGENQHGSANSKGKSAAAGEIKLKAK